MDMDQDAPSTLVASGGRDMESEPNKADQYYKQDGELMKVEDALEKIGGFSRLQFIATFMLSFLECSAAMVVLSPILTSRSDAEYFCETATGLSKKISKERLCNSTCSGNLTATQEFGSFVPEWNLTCDKAWIIDTFTSIQMAGGFCGSLITAHFADRYGRKKAFFTIASILGATGFLCALSPGPVFYGVARFLSGFAASGSFVAHFNYLMELLTPRWRTICGCLSFWALGEMLLGLVGYMSASWRTLSWTSSISAFFVFSVLFILPESPRFLLCQRRTDEALHAFNQIAKINSKPPLTSSEVENLQLRVMQEEEAKPKMIDSWKIFKNNRVRINILVFCFSWFSNAVVYYGLSFNTKNLPGNMYLNVFYLGLVDFPAELSGMYFNNRFGRQKTYSISIVVSSLFLMALVIVEMYSEANSALILIFCLLGRFCNELSWAVMACFTGESFPTIGRNVCMSICLCANAIGGIVAPQVAYLGTISRVAPYLIFCGLSFATALLSLLLIEMKGRPLQDTVATK